MFIILHLQYEKVVSAFLNMLLASKLLKNIDYELPGEMFPNLLPVLEKSFIKLRCIYKAGLRHCECNEVKGQISHPQKSLGQRP